MFPNEVAILTAIKENGGLGLQQLTHVTDISGSCLRYVCNAMCLYGYLERKNTKEYQATRKGEKAIFEAILGN